VFFWEVVLSSKFYQNQLCSFQDMGSKFALSHYIGHWLMQQLVLPMIDVLYNDRCTYFAFHF